MKIKKSFWVEKDDIKILKKIQRKNKLKTESETLREIIRGTKFMEKEM